MRRALAENALAISVAGLASAAMAWLGLYGFAWNDYANEAQPAVSALVHGHVQLFLRLAPAYGGSLVERAPFALAPGLWGGGELAVYRMLALPGLLAAAALGVWLLARMRREGRPPLARAVVLGLCVANPIALPTLELGHSEELLGAALCVGALLLACSAQTAPARSARGRALWAGVALGLAIANKEWALLALGPALLALAPELRRRCLAGAALGAGAVLAPLVLAGDFLTTARAAASPATTIFQPWQLWWFLGHHGALVHGAFGAPKPGYRIAPQWTETISHPLILALGAALAALTLVGRRRARALAGRDALLVLALVLLARCALDTWDTVYYPLPFLFALLAWEARGPSRRPPLLTLCCTLLVWGDFQWLPEHASADAQAALFAACTLPLAGWLCWRLRGAGARAAARAETIGGSAGASATVPVAGDGARAGQAGAGQEIAVSALGRLVRTS